MPKGTTHIFRKGEISRSKLYVIEKTTTKSFKTIQKENFSLIL